MELNHILSGFLVLGAMLGASDKILMERRLCKLNERHFKIKAN